jgi:cytoskeletal protein CcmA (bactofilin family)
MARNSQPLDAHRLDNASFPEVVKLFPVRLRSSSAVVSTWLTKGKLSAEEGLVIDGILECALAHHQQQLTVSKDSHVEANLRARTVVVFGQVIGDIFSDGTVWLARNSDVQGNIRCARLFVEEGARFTGQIETGECAAHEELEYS